MLEAAAHRGPDGRGVWCAGAVGLGHLALQIAPESVGERQPLASADGEVVLVADARIDNRAEVLRRLGLPGNGRSAAVTDAALILAAYRRWGVECAAELVGDFAFALWDARERRLFAARDPLGMRAFYYRVEPERVLFATEIKQILAVPGVPVELFEPMVGAYLAGAFGPAEWTFYAGIQQLAPAHALVVSAAGQRSWRYWDIDPGKRIRYRSDEEYAEHFRELFKEAVRARLRSVKPVGLLLSGGLDSGSIAATAGWLLANEPGVSVPEFRAYSWAFEELTECDERHISGGIAAPYGFPVTAVPADDAWPLSDYPAVLTDRDDPFLFGHYAKLNRGFSAARAEGMGQMLSGDRGDLVAGLSIFDFPALFWRGHWPTLYRELSTLARWKEVPRWRVVRGELLKPAVRAVLPPHSRAARLPFLRLVGTPRAQPVPEWIQSGFARAAGLEVTLAMNQPRPRIRGFARSERYAFVFTPMHMQGIAASERMHAGFGQTFADPWSDRRLAEFSIAVPQRVLNRVGPRQSKRLTRLAMRGIVPEPVRLAMRKIVPTPLWNRGVRERSREQIAELISGMRAARRGYVDEVRLREHYAAFLQDERNDMPLWKAVTLELWLRAYWN